MRRGACEAVPVLAILGSVGLPGAAAAQADLSVRGSLTVAGQQDDNLFSTPAAAERDRVSRLTPEIEMRYRSARLSLSSHYTLDTERFEEHPDLNSTRARQNAWLEMKAHPAPALTIALRGDYVTTLTPGELNLTTGLSAGRHRARRLTVEPSLECQVDPRTTGSLAYTQTMDDLTGGVSAETRTAALGLERRLSPRDTGSLGYTFSRIDFEDGDVVAAHTLSLGWDRRITPHADLTLRAGPRLSEGAHRPEASISIRQSSRRADLLLTYTMSLASVIGQAGTVITESLSPTLSLRPVRSLQVSAAPGLFRVGGTRGGETATVYLLNLETTCRLGPWMSLVGTYQHLLQEGVLGATAGADGPLEIARNTIALRLVARPAAGLRTAAGRIGETR